MSLRDIWMHIKEFITHMGEHMRELVENSLFVTRALQNIEHLLASPEADIVTNLIKGDWDDKLKEKIVAGLQEIIPYLQILQKCPTDDINAMLRCWLEQLQQVSPDIREALLARLGGRLMKYMDGDKHKLSTYNWYLEGKIANQVLDANTPADSDQPPAE